MARKAAGDHPRVLGQVDAATGGDHLLVEVVEQHVQGVVADREVEGQRPAGHGERQRARVAGPEPLEHGQEAGQPERG